MTPRRSLLAAPLLLGPLAARAQEEYPSRPVNVVVPWPPGGPTDAFARLFAQRLSTDLGRPFVVDNRGGASGTIGMAQAARLRADGTNLVITPNSTYAVAQHLYPIQYDAERSFVGVGLLVSSPLFIMVRGNSPHRTLQSFLEAARRPNARVTYANSGVGSTSHLAMEMMMQMAGVTIEEVGYRGGGPAIQAMLAGETDIFCLPAAAAMPQLAAGELRALAATTAQRSRYAPEVPTMQELGFAGFEVVEHVAVLAPVGTPEAILRRLNDASAAALRAPDMAPRLAAMALSVEARPFAEWPAYFRSEADKWRDFVRARNIRVQG